MIVVVIGIAWTDYFRARPSVESTDHLAQISGPLLEIFAMDIFDFSQCAE